MNAVSHPKSFAAKAGWVLLGLFFAAAIGAVAQVGIAHAYTIDAFSTNFYVNGNESPETAVSGRLSGSFAGSGSQDYSFTNNTNYPVEVTFTMKNTDGNHMWTMASSTGWSLSDTKTTIVLGPVTVGAQDYIDITVANPGCSYGAWPYDLVAKATVKAPASSGSDTSPGGGSSSGGSAVKPGGSSGGTGTSSTPASSASKPIAAKPGFPNIGSFNLAMNLSTDCIGASGQITLCMYYGELVNAKATIAGKTVAKWGKADSDGAVKGVDVSGLKPGKRYPVKVTGVIKCDGSYYKGSFSTKTRYVTTKKMSKPSVKATKLSRNKASVRVSVPVKEVAKKKFQVRLYANGKCIKKMKTNGSTTYRYVYTKFKAGSKKYSAKVVYLASAEYAAKSKAKKPVANVKKWGYRRSVSAYTDMWQGFRPTKAYYKNGKLKIKGFFINSHYYTLSHMKLKFQCRASGKTVGTKVLSSGRMKPHSIKSVTFTCKGSKLADLPNSYMSWRYDTLSWK